ncbi:hypothetical protein GLOIN_2v1782310 [Rhizophagus clarus]|uniref:Uncharacterized protein n=1 Tax=Rhizophagus clarus TaxID=94130 RepID=A0A8H3MFX8_9GLOM|nr:hypothetical protein GLOIN_2v1782310 [Rhizophagus clarus]
MSEIKETDLIKFSNDIIDASVQLQIASLCLRSCFVSNDLSVPEFVQLRGSVINEAKVYNTKILSFASAVITFIQQFCENYTFLTFEQFVYDIVDLADEANQRVQLSRFTAELHKSILVGEQELCKTARTNYIWAFSLAFVPIVNVIATPILFSRAESAIRKAAAVSCEGDIAVAASRVIDVLTNELNMLVEDHHQEVPHYIKIQSKAKIIIDACQLYMSRIPDCETNLRAIPDNYDKNYVQEWLSNEQVKVNGKSTSFLTWGRSMFEKNKQFIKLLAN